MPLYDLVSALVDVVGGSAVVATPLLSPLLILNLFLTTPLLLPIVCSLHPRPLFTALHRRLMSSFHVHLPSSFLTEAVRLAVAGTVGPRGLVFMIPLLFTTLSSVTPPGRMSEGKISPRWMASHSKQRRNSIHNFSFLRIPRIPKGR
jgi:hypothetical protein